MWWTAIISFVSGGLGLSKQKKKAAADDRRDAARIEDDAAKVEKYTGGLKAQMNDLSMQPLRRRAIRTRRRDYSRFLKRRSWN